MEIDSLRDIDNILQECRDCEKVLVPDEALAAALNARVQESGRKKFEVPERSAKVDPSWGRELFFRLKTDRSWREASLLRDAAESCLRGTGGLEALEELDLETEQAADLAAELAEPREKIEERVSVVGKGMMDGFQRSLLPDRTDEVELFDGSTEMQQVCLFGSHGKAAEVVLDAVRKLGAGNVGVVAAEGSTYRATVVSRLEANSVPHTDVSSFGEAEDLRTFVSLLRAGISSGSLSLSSARPLLDQLGIEYPEEKAGANIETIEGLESFRELLSVLPSLEFGEALKRFESMEGPTGIEEVLEELNVLEEPVTDRRLSELEYYFESVERGSAGRQGVKIAGPDACFVDRQAVFLLGADDGWNPETGEWPWSDAEREAGRRKRQMNCLLQSGSRTFLLAVTNSDSAPCVQLRDLLGDLEEFEELPHETYDSPSRDEGEGFENQEIELKDRYKEPTSMISQSQLNDLALSPRNYFFSRLVRDVERLEMEKGSLYHDFAEFYLSHPDFVEERGTGFFAETILEELEEFAESGNRPGLETEVRNALENLKNFLEPAGVSNPPFETAKRVHGNRFSEIFDREIRTENTEVRFESAGKGLKGKIDLLEEDTIFDFKSGRRRSATRSFRASHPDLYHDERFPDFQPLLYTFFLSEHIKDRMRFRYFYFLNSLGAAVKGERDPEDDAVELSYVPSTFADYSCSREFFRKIIGDVAESNDRRKTLEKLGHQSFSSFMESAEVPEFFDADDLRKTDFFQEILELAKEELGDYKYVSNGMESAAGRMADIRTSNFFRDDLERFEEFLKEMRENLEIYLEQGFPVGERDTRELPHREMILE